MERFFATTTISCYCSARIYYYYFSLRSLNNLFAISIAQEKLLKESSAQVTEWKDKVIS